MQKKHAKVFCFRAKFIFNLNKEYKFLPLLSRKKDSYA